jgi:hypothetical protein
MSSVAFQQGMSGGMSVDFASVFGMSSNLANAVVEACD